ncbi:MAG: preprotein translocase subunit SecA [Rhodothermales bacterium]|nr:preprotein translocase subunit SecA [Rhodothermales bacterium]
MLQFFKKLFGDNQAREIRKFAPVVDQINAIYATLADLSDDDLRARSAAVRQRVQEAVAEIEEEKAAIQKRLRTADVLVVEGDADTADTALEALSPEARHKLLDELDDLGEEWLETVEEVLTENLAETFAIVKDTCRRLTERQHTYTAGGNAIVWDMIPYDVQLVGGIALHQGKIAEMKTGEGKTLVSVSPIFLNALAGRGVHVVTVNPYLAQRDAEWMEPVFAFHGLTVDVIDKHEPSGPSRRAAYLADVTYGTNNEFGFDYLRDNSFVFDADQLSQRQHHFAIVDEVDSVLIDEARTPLIISGPVQADQQQQRFEELRPAIDSLVFQQQKLVAQFVAEAEREIKLRDEAGGKGRDAKKHEEAAGLALLRAHRGFPRNKRLQKFLQEPGMGTLLQKTEFYYLQDSGKEMPFVDEALYFALDERNHSIEMTDMGREYAAKQAGTDTDLFILPDIGAETADLERSRADALAAGTEEIAAVEAFENDRRTLYARYSERAQMLHAIEQLLRAYTLFEKDVEYIVQDDKVMIVDEHTGRVLPGRRYSDGLHQAIEAKEKVQVQAATQTYATITLQNYFRLYHKLAGMTGTAETEAEEFYKIYKLEVVVVPTNRPIQRSDRDDIIYRTKREKYNAVIDKIREYHEKGQPVLVGTASVETSETISRMLTRAGIAHNVLNAKQDRAKQEADIVAEAGRPGAVTIATNMAGRGTDIKLGEGVHERGGLAILGTERHESRRIDLQLRGRSGRQGDPGESVFFVSFEDDLMRLFGDRAAKVFDTFKLEEGTSLEHPWASKSIERAQKKVEQNNFGIRKRQLEFDDVLNAQRTVIYERRGHALHGDRTRDDVLDMIEAVAKDLASRHHTSLGTSSLAELREEVRLLMAFDLTLEEDEYFKMDEEDLGDFLAEESERVYEAKRAAFAKPFYEGMVNLAAQYPDEASRPQKLMVDLTDGRRYLRATARLEAALQNEGQELNDALERSAMLSVIDERWTEHLRDLDEVREGVNLRSYGQKDPLIEYKMEAFRLFEVMMKEIDRDVVGLVFKAGPLAQGAGSGGDLLDLPAPTQAPRPPAIAARKPSFITSSSQGEQAMKQAKAASDGKHAPNQLVTIQNPATGQTLQIKYKHARARLAQGWTLVD